MVTKDFTQFDTGLTGVKIGEVQFWPVRGPDAEITHLALRWRRTVIQTVP